MKTFTGVFLTHVLKWSNPSKIHRSKGNCSTFAKFEETLD